MSAPVQTKKTTEMGKNGMRNSSKALNIPQKKVEAKPVEVKNELNSQTLMMKE